MMAVNGCYSLAGIAARLGVETGLKLIEKIESTEFDELIVKLGLPAAAAAVNHVDNWYEAGCPEI